MDRRGIAPGALIQALRQNDNTRVGATAMVEYEGSHDECVNTQAWLISLGATDTDLASVGNGYWRITANFPFGFDGQVTNFPDIPSIHELEVNTLQTSVYRSTKLRNYLSPKHIGIVHKVVSDYQSGIYQQDNSVTPPLTPEALAEADVVAQVQAEGTAPAGRTNAQAQLDAANLFRAVAYLGIEDGIEYTNVYRRTLTAATPQQVQASYEGVGKIWTTAEVQGWEGLDPSGWFVLDPGMQWLKSKPQVVAIAGQKTQIVYSYIECVTAFGLFYDAYKAATLVYGPAA